MEPDTWLKEKKKTQMVILQLNNKITKTKNSLDGFNRRLDTAEERFFFEPEYKSLEHIQIGAQ